MAIRLNELVEGGVVYNRRKNSVNGQLFLRDVREPITLELTGNPEADLAGRSFEFFMPESVAEPSDEDYEIARAMEPRQIGPVGEITAARKVRVTMAPETGGSEGKPTAAETWQYCLYLEWFGQNGRVVAELPGAHIRLLDVDVPQIEETPDEETGGGDRAEAGPGAAWTGAAEEPEDEGDDPYDLFDEDLEAQIAASTEEEGDFFAEGDDGADIIDNLERMDAQMESGDTMPMRDLLEEGTVLPPPDDISEEDAAALLKTLLARFALFGIAFDMCEHATARQAYRVLLEEVIDGDNVLPGMFGSGWVQHFGTHDTCPECQRELDEEMGGSGYPTGDPDDEAPF